MKSGVSCDKNRIYVQISPEGMGRVGQRGREGLRQGPCGRRLGLLGLVGPPALQQGGQLLPEEDEEVM